MLPPDNPEPAVPSGLNVAMRVTLTARHGQTELARTLAEAAGLALHGVGEEPSRGDRLNGLHLAQRVLARTTGALLLFDEMEDLIGEAQPSGGDWYAERQGSKVFVNRLLETNPVPVVWTTNAIGNVAST